MSALMLSLIIVSSFVAHKLLVCLYAWYASLLVLLKVLHLHLQFVFVFFMLTCRLPLATSLHAAYLNFFTLLSLSLLDIVWLLTRSFIGSISSKRPGKITD